MDKKRKQQMFDYLNTLKFAHESHALNETKWFGSEQYIEREMDRAKMIGEIIEIVSEHDDHR